MATYSDGKIIYGKGFFQNATGATGTYTLQTNDIIEYTVHLAKGTTTTISNGATITLSNAIGSNSKQFNGVASSGSIQLTAGTGSVDWILTLGRVTYGFETVAADDLIHVEYVIYRNISGT